jgi:hypothetical protein
MALIIIFGAHVGSETEFGTGSDVGVAGFHAELAKD